MIEVKGDLWRIPCHWLCITTNGIVKDSGEAVMGKGCALEAAQKFWDLPMVLGELIKARGNHVHFLKKMGRTEYVPKDELYWDKWVCVSIFSFPTKNHFKERSDLELIDRSAKELRERYDAQILTRKLPYDVLPVVPKIVLPRPGCGCGGRDWEKEVKPILEKHFDTDDFIICTPP